MFFRGVGSETRPELHVPVCQSSSSAYVSTPTSVSQLRPASLSRRDKAYAISTEPFTAQADSGTKKDAAKIGGGAALGAIVGAIAGGGKGAAIGAGVGAGAGTGVVLATKGEQFRLEPETKVNFVLKRDVDIVLTKSTT